MRAEIVVMRLADIGAQVDLRKVRTLRGQAASPSPFLAQSPMPVGAGVSAPMETVADIEASMPDARLELRLHSTGVLVARVRWHVEVERFAELRAAAAGLRIAGRALEELIVDWAAEIRIEHAAALHDVYEVQVEPEHWTTYVISSPEMEGDWLEKYRVPLAALVSDTDREDLVPERIDAAWRHMLRYGPQEVVLPGWDHGVVFTPTDAEDVLDVLELANLELLELRTYDSYLDGRLETSFDALDRLWGPTGMFRSARAALRDISQVRVELARLTDSLHDTGKLFGDWYTAELHNRLQTRFHISDWEAAVQGKMKALEDMFHLAQEEANHRRALILESMIVLLFILDLWLLFKLE